MAFVTFVATSSFFVSFVAFFVPASGQVQRLRISSGARPSRWRRLVHAVLVIHGLHKRTHVVMKRGTVIGGVGTEAGCRIGAPSPCVSVARSPASTPYCDPGSTGERTL